MDIIDINQLLENTIGLGWRVTSPYFFVGSPVSLGGSVTANVPTTQDWPGTDANQTLSGGNGLVVTDILTLSLDGEFDYIRWAIRQNGFNLNGVEFIPSVGTNRWTNIIALIAPGARWSLRTENLSGTNSALYPPTTAVRVQGGIKGYLYRYMGSPEGTVAGDRAIALAQDNLETALARIEAQSGLGAQIFRPEGF